MMEGESLGALYGLLEASMWELPLALQKWMFGASKGSHEVEEAVTKVAQAWTNLANEGVERVGQAQGFVGLTTASVKHLVQCQRVARDFMESLVPGFGSVKSGAADSEIAELRESVNKLRREIGQLTARVSLMDRRDSAQPSPVDVGAAVRVPRNRF
jgi:hypothetical protein